MESETIIAEIIDVPKDVKCVLEDKRMKIKGPKGELHRDFSHARAVKIDKDKNKIKLSITKINKKNRALINTLKSHINNMIDGVTKGPFIVKLKIVYAHFPINVKVKDGIVYIENFLGERNPRKAKIFGEKTEIVLEGDDILVKNIDIEKAGQTAANIQKITKIKEKDPRTFQDGIFKYQKFLGDQLIWKLKF
ncbi:MAG: 50S ribosomal protein L6 [Candidatus Helarchaeota archaeon]